MPWFEDIAQSAIARKRAQMLINDVGAGAFSNTVTETTLLSAGKAIPGGLVNPGDLFVVSFGLIWLNNTGATQTLTLKCKIGGTAIVNLVTPAVAASATTYNVAVEAWVRWPIGGTTNAVSMLIIGQAAGTGTVKCDTYMNPAQGSFATPSGALDITGQLSTATATGTVTPKGSALLWVPGAA
jgi:hypothetical protein